MKFIILVLIFSSIILSQEIKTQKEFELGNNDQFFFNELRDISFRKDHFYLADWKDFTVYKFKNNGEFVSTTGRQGNGPGEFSDGPKKLGWINDTLLVVDGMGNQIIHYFTEELKYIKSKTLLETPKEVIIKDEVKIIATSNYDSGKLLCKLNKKLLVNNTIELKNLSTYPPENQFNLTIDEQNNIIVQYPYRNIVQIYNKNGNFSNEITVDNVKRKSEFKELEGLLGKLKKKMGSKTALVYASFSDDLVLSRAFGFRNKLFIQGGRYKKDKWKTIFVYSYEGEYLSELQIPEKDKFAGIDLAGNIFTYDEDRMVLRKINYSNNKIN